jgi:cytochrome P450
MASRVLKDGKLFTMRKDDGDVAAMRWWILHFRVLTNHMLTVDEPDHTRLRGIVTRRSSPGRSRWSRTSARSPTTRR